MAVLYKRGSSASIVVVFCSIGRKKRHRAELIILDRDAAEEAFAEVIEDKVEALLAACGCTASPGHVWAALNAPTHVVRPPLSPPHWTDEKRIKKHE